MKQLQRNLLNFTDASRSTLLWPIHTRWIKNYATIMRNWPTHKTIAMKVIVTVIAPIVLRVVIQVAAQT